MSALTRLGVPKIRKRRPAQSVSERQAQTRDTFSYKWAKRDVYESENVQSHARQWQLERYCDGDSGKLDAWFTGDRKIILDAGCGSGCSALALFGDHLNDHDYLGVDISDAVDIARKRFEEWGYEGDFLKVDLMDLPFPEESIDIIFSEGVLHHTDSTERAISYLSTKLKKGGLFLFYVYAKKADIREFTDDHVRASLQNLTEEEAWKALIPLTKLGIALGELDIEIDVPEDIPFLGIKQGKYNLQRFFYWNICKAFYRPDFTFDQMNLTNFDWFRPLNCHRQTPQEVRKFCDNAGLSIEHMNVQEAGITVVARKI